MKKRKFVSKTHIKFKFVANCALVLLIVMAIGYATVHTQLGITGNIDVSKVSITASTLTFDNTSSGVNCSDSQCMIDYINDLLG